MRQTKSIGRMRSRSAPVDLWAELGKFGLFGKLVIVADLVGRDDELRALVAGATAKADSASISGDVNHAKYQDIAGFDICFGGDLSVDQSIDSVALPTSDQHGAKQFGFLFLAFFAKIKAGRKASRAFIAGGFSVDGESDMDDGI